MAEKEPGAILGTAEVPKVETPEISSLRQTIETMQAELEKAQKELALAEHLRDQETAFGKHDVTAPNEGEDSYRSYLDQRPASAADDTELTGQDYYHSKANNDETVSFGPEMFEDMGVMELAKQAAIARTEGNSAREGVIREALEHHLTMDAMADDSVSSELAQEGYDKDLKRFDELVARFQSRGNPQSPHAGEAHTKPSGEGEPSARTADAKDEVAPIPSKELTSRTDSWSADRKAQEAVAPKKDTEPDDKTFGGYFKDMPVSVADVTPHPTDSSKDMLKVVGEDGRVRRILAADFTSEPVIAKADTTPAAAQPEKTLGNGFTVPALGVEGDNRKPGKELVLFQGEADTEAEAENRLDVLKARLKSWLPNFQRNSGSTVWADMWARVKRGEKAGGLDHGIPAETPQNEREPWYRRNRIKKIAGWAAIGTVTAGALFLGLSNDRGDREDILGNTPTATAGPSPEAPTPPTAPEDDQETTPPNNGVRWTPEDLNGEVKISDPIPQGGGGEQLFKGLGVDISKWYNNEDTLLQLFPDEFYRMNDGHVGIAKPGPLSQEAQDFITSLQ